MSVLDKFLDAIRLNDDYEEEDADSDSFFDEEDDDIEEKPKKRFFRKLENEDEDEEDDLRARLKAPAANVEQALYVSDALKTGRVMVKDENICLHCGMCAERCPTGAWDMQIGRAHV